MTKSNESTAKFWDHRDDAEHLDHTDIATAVEMWEEDQFPEPLPETITVYGFAPKAMYSAERIAERVLEYLTERLDEDFGDPEGHETDIPEAVETAAKAFAAAVHEHWPVWQCEEVERVVVRVADYVNVTEYEEAAKVERAKASSHV